MLSGVRVFGERVQRVSASYHTLFLPPIVLLVPCYPEKYTQRRLLPLSFDTSSLHLTFPYDALRDAVCYCTRRALSRQCNRHPVIQSANQPASPTTKGTMPSQPNHPVCLDTLLLYCNPLSSRSHPLLSLFFSCFPLHRKIALTAPALPTCSLHFFAPFPLVTCALLLRLSPSGL